MDTPCFWSCSNQQGPTEEKISLLTNERTCSRWSLKLELRAECGRLLGNSSDQFKWMKPKESNDRVIPAPCCLAHCINEKTKAWSSLKSLASRLSQLITGKFTIPFTRLFEFSSWMFLLDLTHCVMILVECLLKKTVSKETKGGSSCPWYTHIDFFVILQPNPIL